jgi:putative membrane protein
VNDSLVWQRVHPVTPAVKGWKVVAVMIAIGAQQVGTNVGSAGDLIRSVGWGPVVGVLAAAVLIGFVYAGIAWRMTRYAVDGEAVYLQSGVLFRQQRTARLDRVQAIDVVQPLLARLLGLAELKFEVAGGNDSAVRLAFLKEEAAQQLRNELLARSAGVAFGTPEQPEAPIAPEREVLVVSAPRLLGALLRSGAVLVAAGTLAAAVVVVVITREAALVLGMLPMLLGAAGFLWQRFAGEFNFRAAQSPDGIRLRHGLLEQRSQTLPPGRVQAVRLSQGWLWRRKDWWRVEVNVAGYGRSEDNATQNVLLPVGDRDEALLALWLVLPDLGTTEPQALLGAALSGDGPAGGFVTSPRAARRVDPLSWRRNGYAVTDRALVVRRGRLSRQVDVVPHERTQSVGLTQGPLQRRLGLASVSLHSTQGPIAPVVAHLTAGDAGALVGEQADRARAARAGAGPERWMQVARAAAFGDEPPTSLGSPSAPSEPTAPTPPTLPTVPPPPPPAGAFAEVPTEAPPVEVRPT